MKTVTTIEMLEHVNRNAEGVLIDVSHENFFHIHHIPNSRNVPLRDPAEFIEEVSAHVPEWDTPIILYARRAEDPEAARAAHVLAEAGFRDVRQYPGGVLAWQQAGLETQAE